MQEYRVLINNMHKKRQNFYRERIFLCIFFFYLPIYARDASSLDPFSVRYSFSSVRANQDPSSRQAFSWVRKVYVPFSFCLPIVPPPAKEDKIEFYDFSKYLQIYNNSTIKYNEEFHNFRNDLKITPPHFLPDSAYRVTIDMTDINCVSNTMRLSVEKSPGSIRFLFKITPKERKNGRKKDGFDKEKCTLINEALNYIERYSYLIKIFSFGITLNISTKCGGGFLGNGDIYYVLGRLSQMEVLDNLRNLSLCRNTFNDEDASSIAAWLPYIRSSFNLKLDNCYITQKGRNIIIEAALRRGHILISDTNKYKFFYSFGAIWGTSEEIKSLKQIEEEKCKLKALLVDLA